MAERKTTVKILELEEATAKNGNTYLKIRWEDVAKGSTHGKNCFAPQLFPVFRMALAEAGNGARVDIIHPAEGWDIADAILSGVEGSEEAASEAKAESVKAMEKQNPPEKQYKADPAKTESIESQVALKTAIELAVADKIPIDKIFSYTEAFRRYLRGDITVKDEAVFTALIKKTFEME